jgi:hypothetical protein
MTYTEQDVHDALNALRTRTQAASEYIDPEQLIRDCHVGPADGGIPLTDELAHYRRGAELLDAGLVVRESPHFDATLSGGVHYERMESNPKRVAPIIRQYAGYVATSEMHCLVTLLQGR